MMSEVWAYNSQVYNSEEDLNAAVVSLKSRLDSNPTDWVIVKESTSDGNGGWVVSPTPLTDEEILSLDTTKSYNVSSVPAGETHIGLDGASAQNKVWELRRLYANWVRANTVFKEYAPTETDMSGYV